MNKCTAEDCQRPARYKFYCAMHYKLWKRNGSPSHRLTIAQRFNEFWRLQQGPLDSQCHIWTGRLSDRGYGLAGLVRAHRLAWELVNGPIATGMCVLHRCDVRACVNVDHLKLGTQLENIMDRDSKGRAADVSGEANPFAKLRVADVLLIRKRHASGVKQNQIAADMEISCSTVNAIIKRRKWAHI